MIPAVDVFRVGKHELRNAPAAVPEPPLEAYDAVGVGYRQRFQCHRVVGVEERGVHPDSERQQSEQQGCHGAKQPG